MERKYFQIEFGPKNDLENTPHKLNLYFLFKLYKGICMAHLGTVQKWKFGSKNTGKHRKNMGQNLT
jgi:hypothetical protein